MATRLVYAPANIKWHVDRVECWTQRSVTTPTRDSIPSTIHAAEFLELNSKPVVLYELAKGWITGIEPDLGKMHEMRQR